MQQLVVAIQSGLLLGCHFLVGEKLLVSQFRGTLEWRDGLVRVGPLQVGIAPRRTRRVLAFGAGGCQHDEGDHAPHRPESQSKHPTPLIRM